MLIFMRLDSFNGSYWIIYFPINNNVAKFYVMTLYFIFAFNFNATPPAHYFEMRSFSISHTNITSLIHCSHAAFPEDRIKHTEIFL